MNIKAVISRQGFTMQQVAEKLNISQQAVSQAVNGNPSLSRLKEIAKAVGVTVSELVADDETDERESESKPVFSIITCPYCRRELKLTKADDEPNPNRSNASS